MPGMGKLVDGQQRNEIASWFSFTTSSPFSVHSIANRGLQIEKQQFLCQSSSLKQWKSPVHPLIEESKVEVGGGVEGGARHQQVVGADQACRSPLLNVTPVSSIYCPQSFSGGGLYLKVKWLLWSVKNGLLWYMG